MSNHQRRLKEIEVSLTPHQLVLLWMKSVLSGTYEEGAFGTSTPRATIANSIARIVSESLKGEPESVVERAVLQARQEADWLYMIVIEVNSGVQKLFFESEREYLFLLAYLASTMKHNPLLVSEEPLRSITLAFVEPILLLEGAVPRTSAERFDGHPILFSDSAIKLKEQVKLAEEALGFFNSIASHTHLRMLDKKEISDSLVPAMDLRVSLWSMIARGGMLAVYGEWCEFKATFKQLAQSYSSVEVRDDKNRGTNGTH